MIRNLEGAKCVGRYDLFDATDIASTREAAAICATCPVALACDEFRKGEPSRLGTPTGTWAGKLVGVRRKAEHGNAKPREHGTTRGYYQHTNRKEDVCADCRVAMRAAMDERLKGIAS